MFGYTKQLFIVLGVLLLASSCGIEEFASKKKKDSLAVNGIITTSQSACSQFTYIKPKVDFLFLWDNSSSAVFINSQTRQALNQTIDLISTRFDYHIMLAPLVLPQGASVNSYAGLIVSDTPSGEMTSQALAMRIDRSNAANHLSSFPSVAQSAEYGTQRSIDLLNTNKTNNGSSYHNAFRRNAHTIVVVMSTEDDDGALQGNGGISQNLNNFVSSKTSALNNLKNSLDAIQLRFFSIVRKSVCNQYGPMNPFAYSEAYRRVSEQVFLSQSPTPSDIGNNRDSFDLCSVSDFTTVFDGINNSIQDFILGHKYNYWPVAQAGANIDPNEITVTKDGTSYPRLNEPVSNGANGFSFTNAVQTVNTRFAPDAGEPFTGYVVKLYGNAQVTYPECMSVRTQTVQEWYGYAHMQSKPVESSIQLKIDGVPVSKCGTNLSTCNGYELIKSGAGPTYISNQNMRIEGPNNFTPKSPGLVKSGYFLKLHGNAAYSNGQSVEIIYDPSGT
ncbi:MAG: hypothetical protein CME71_08465 [Halobacteriovorax sp.]|nr:hypothetical protein [Halobacteriovorax sp.]